jgi:hypothetical protein
MAFNTDNKRYFEITENERRELLARGGAIKHLI